MAVIEALETIGARGRRITTERQVRRLPTIPHAPPVSQQAETHSSIQPHVSNQSSKLPIGRHRPEYILAQGETPRYMLTVAAKPVPPSEPILPPVPALQPASEPLPRRVPHASRETPVGYPAQATETSTPALRPLPKKRRSGNIMHTLLEKLKDQHQPDLLTQVGAFPHEEPGLLGATGTFAATLTEPMRATPLRCATEKGVHAKKKPNRTQRLVAGATAAVITGFAILGGTALFRDKQTVPLTPNNNSVKVQVPDLPHPRESLPTPVVHITETSIISAQDGNQWNASASKTFDAIDHQSNVVTNIVAKIGAYESRVTNPDPDTAQAGDSFTTLTAAAIRVVDRLGQPPGPDAPHAEVEAAQLINQLNSLGPMATKVFIQNYGSEIEALKTQLTAILTPQQEQQTSYQKTQVSGPTQIASTSTTKETGKQMPIFSLAALSPTQEKALRKGKKAIAALARDQQKRQSRRSFV